MKQQIGSLVLVFAFCATVPAQRNDGAKNETTDQPTPQASVQAPLINYRVFPLKQDQTGSNTEKRNHPVSIIQMKYVVNDGALYLDIFGNGTLIPVPGGGASGCFSLDLPQRRERLRNYIESLPQEKPPAVRQTEAHAM
jgi:hypothetical protein